MSFFAEKGGKDNYLIMDESKASKLQDFAHRILKFATTARCIQYFEESSSIDYDAVDVHGCTILMTACAYGRDDVIVYLAQRTHYFLSTTIAVCKPCFCFIG